ncbi:MAG TPA: LysR family transcriptional regulator, partial [Usitatibacter sp.]
MIRRLPPLSALRPFEAAARLESFSRAADELHVTHGAVSRQVRALEEHVGAPLFARHGKRVSLTPAGRAFAERIRGALQEIAQAAEAAGVARREGSLTVSVLPSFASRWLMPRLIRFMDANPKIEINVLTSNALANFGSDGVDVAIRYGRGAWPGLVSEKFLEDDYFPVASPKMNRGKLPREPRDLLKVRIMREDRDYWERWLEAAG